jgi:hypothetical protein
MTSYLILACHFLIYVAKGESFPSHASFTHRNSTLTASESSDVSKWTTAIKGKDETAIRKQVQYVRGLLSQAQVKADTFAKQIQPLTQQTKDLLMLYDEANITSELSLLNSFFDGVKDLHLEQELDAAHSWFKERESAGVTPVTGDVRSPFSRAHKTFLKQGIDYAKIAYGPLFMLPYVKELEGKTDPQSREDARRQGLALYVFVGNRTGNDAMRDTTDLLEKFEDYFSQTWNRTLSKSLHSDDLKEWTESIRNNDKVKVHELIQPVREILFTIINKGKKIYAAIEMPFFDLSDAVVIPQTVNVSRAIGILEPISELLSELEVHEDVKHGLEWFDGRLTDDATLVTGDSRVWLDQAFDGFETQLRDSRILQDNVDILLQGLRKIEHEIEDPAVVRQVRMLATTFQSLIMGRIEMPAMKDVDECLQEFDKTWKRANNYL